MKFNTQDVFDDFMAGAEYLIREGYTTPSRLIILGDDGGAVMGRPVGGNDGIERRAACANGHAPLLARCRSVDVPWSAFNSTVTLLNSPSFARLG
jgi:prolyl oligopeptidase